VDGDGLVPVHRFGALAVHGDGLVVVDRLGAVVLHVHGLVVVDGLGAVVADPVGLVVLDLDVLVLLGMQVHLLRLPFLSSKRNSLQLTRCPWAWSACESRFACGT
jgi:hypothetical protein